MILFGLMMKRRMDLYWTKSVGLRDFLQLIFDTLDTGKVKNGKS